ncbi:MAG: anthranilate synthase component II [Oscillospiraceae bacterium]|jgi:anthranilate synthase component 2
MILLIDNYDSFSYNLYQLIGSVNPDIQVMRNDAMTVEEVRALQPDAIILSPGPGKPENAGICVELVKELGNKFPILGVCLGHQAICTAYGATVSYTKTLMHGKQSQTFISRKSKLFSNCPQEIPVARYHSLAVIEDTLPTCLEIIAKADDGEIMAVQHTEYDIYGLQFHPESIMTPNGIQIIENFLNLVKEH